MTAFIALTIVVLLFLAVLFYGATQVA